MYNFNTMEKIIGNIKIDKSRPSHLKDLKNELNKFFNDSICEDVLFTENNDKMFFGMCVLPRLRNGREIIDIVEGKHARFTRYYLELDSKLFNPSLGITTKELTAILLHEVGHVVNNRVICNGISKEINYYISKEGVTLDYNEIMNHYKFYHIGVLRAIRKLGSIFEKNKEEFIADEFVVKCGYGSELESVYDKIISNRDIVQSPSENKLMALFWTISVNGQLKKRKKAIIGALEESKYGEGSSLFNRKYNDTINSLKRIKINFTNESNENVESILNESSFIKKIKFSGIKSLEDDLYEFKIKINMIGNNNEALDILRSINMRINLIEEYINSYSNLNKNEIDRLHDLSNKYKFIRDEMIRTGNYDKRTYGLFVKYPNINNRRM